MTTEELRVKIVVDTSGVQQSVNKIKQSFNSIEGETKKVSTATGLTSDSVKELGDQLQAIKSLNFSGVIASQFDTIKTKVGGAAAAVKIGFTDAGRHIKEAGVELKGAFNFKNFDVGNDGIKGYLKSMSLQAKEAAGSVKASTKKIGEAFRSMGSVISSALSSTTALLIAFAAAVAGVAASIKNAFSTAQYLKVLNSEAQKIGLSINAYQEWAYVLDQTGVEADKLSDFIKTLTEEQLAVREGSEDAINAFKRLGMAAEDVINMSQDQLFKETVKRLQNVKNETERTSLAYQIFGEDAAEIANVLRLTNSETESLASNMYLLGASMSQSLIEKSTALSSAVSNLRMAWRGFTNTLAEVFMPIITKVVEWLTKAVVVVNLFLKTVFNLDMTPAISSVGAAVGGIGSYAEGVEDATNAVEKLKRVTAGFDELNIIGNPNTSTSSTSGATTVPGADTAIDTSTSVFTKAQEQIEAFQEKVKGFLEEWKTQIQIIGAALGALTLGNILSHLGSAIGLGDKFLGVMSQIKNLAVGAIVITLQYTLVNEFMDNFIDGEGFKEYLKGLVVAAIGTGILYAMWGPAGLVVGLAVTAVASIKAVIDNGGITNVESGVVAFTGLATAIGAVVAGIKLLAPAIASSNLGAFIALLGEGNSIGSVLAAAFPKIAGALTTAGGALSGFLSAVGGLVGGGVAAGLAIVAAAIAAVVSVVIFLKENWDGVTAAVKAFFETNIVPKLEALRESWEKIKTAVKEAGQAILNALPPEVREIIENIGKAIKDVIDKIVEWFKSVEWLEAIGKVFEVIGGIIFGVVSGVIAGAISTLATMLEGIASVITGLVEIVSGVIEAIVGIITLDGEKIKSGAKKIIDGVVDVFKGLWTATVGAVVEFVQGVIDWFTALWDELVGHSIVPDMIEAIIEWFLSLPGKIFGKLQEFVNGVIQKFKNMWDGVSKATTEKLTAIKNGITNAWNTIKGWFTSNVAPKFTKQYWLNKFDVIRAGISDKLTAAKSTMTNLWGSITGWFKSSVAPKFTLTYWKNKFDTIKNGAKSAFNGVISVVESAVNGIIRKINTLSWTIPDWVPVFGGDRFGFNFRTISIPRLATGGIATSSTIANIGENGREAVLPLERNTQWMDILADRIAARNSAPSKIVLKVGERELGWATINGINQITKQTGELQLCMF